MKKGIVVALITPLNEDETIDVKSLHSLLEWVLAGGVEGVFVGGTVGEGAALRDTEKFTLYKETVACVRRRVPVLANVSDVGTIRSLELLKLAEAAKVDAAVTTARYSFPQRTEFETVTHVHTLADKSSVPVWFYENPSTTNVTSSFDIICRILDHSNIGGLKFTSADRELLRRCVAELEPDCPVMTGNVPDIAYAASIGATGAISGIGSLLPHLCVETFKAALSDDIESAQALQKTISSVYSIYGGTGWPLWPSAQKHCLKRQGIIRTSVSTAPFCRLSPVDEAMIDSAWEEFNLSLENKLDKQSAITTI